MSKHDFSFSPNIIQRGERSTSVNLYGTFLKKYLDQIGAQCGFETGIPLPRTTTIYSAVLAYVCRVLEALILVHYDNQKQKAEEGKGEP